MPARKHRPGKFGAKNQSAKIVKIEDGVLANKLWAQEMGHPNAYHYVGWPDMCEAEQLEKNGYLVESDNTTGCFRLTQRFRDVFMNKEIKV